MRFHASGHLASIHVPGTRKHNGRLDLDAQPGAGRFTFTSHAGGMGFYIEEEYRDGEVHTTFCSPWHDGEQSSEPMPWREWVDTALASLASIT